MYKDKNHAVRKRQDQTGADNLSSESKEDGANARGLFLTEQKKKEAESAGQDHLRK